MTLSPIPKTTIQTLIQQYDVLLLDAYGVLVNQKEALPGAIGFIQHLNQIKKPYLILTNGSSSPITKMASRYQEKGLSISAKCPGRDKHPSSYVE